MARVTGTRTLIPQTHTLIEQHNNWWSHKTVTQRNIYMLDNSIDTDITFVFKRILAIPTSDSGGAASEKRRHEANDDEEFVDCPTTSEQQDQPSTSSSMNDTSESIQVDNEQHEPIPNTHVEAPTIIDQERVELEAHRYMLLSASCVFWKLLHAHFDKDEISIEDVEPDTFQLMLRFIYTDTTDVTEHTVIPLLNASKLYDLPALSTKCSEWLENHVKPENACTLLQHSIKLSQENLALRCLKVIQNHTTEAFESQDFVEISQETLCHILNGDCLSIPEVTVFHYCSVWATKQLMQTSETFSGQALREQLGPVLYQIRLPTLSLQDFTSIIVPTNILSKEEELAIFRCLSMGQNSKCDLTLPFPKEPRRLTKPHVEPTPQPSESAAENTDSQSANSTTNASVPSISAAEDTKREHKVVWSSKSKVLKVAKNGCLLLAPPYLNKVKVQQCVPPTAFTLTLNAVTDPVLVSGMRLGAPINNRSYTDTTTDPPHISIFNCTSRERLLHRYPIHEQETKMMDGFAFVDVAIQPLWLLAQEVITIDITYNVTFTQEDDQTKNSLFKTAWKYATKALKTNHKSYGIQVLPAHFVLSTGEKKVEVNGNPHCPLLGLLYEIN